MTFDQFFRVIKARIALVLSLAGAIVAIVLAINLILPKGYQAIATVMIDARPDPVAITSMAMGQSANYVATQVDIIKSPTVAQRVVRTLKLDEMPALRARWEKEAHGQGNYVAWVADQIARGLEVRPAHESNVIEIQYEGADPKFSAVLANTFAQAYIDSTVQLRVDPARRYADFFEERARLARDKLETAQNKLAEAQKAKGIVLTEERLDVEMARLNDLASQVTSLRALKAETGSRSRVTRDNPDRAQDVLNSPVVAGLKSDIARTEARLEELNARYGDAFPTVKETRANLAALRERLRTEMGRVSSAVTLTDSVSDAREAAAEKAYDEQRERVLKLKEDRIELQVLERDVESAQRIYESIQLRLSQSSLESNSNQANISILSPATEPLKSSSPRVFINTLAAATLGTFLAIMVALGVEMLDRKVRGPFDMVQILEVPVLGVLPSPNGRKPLLRRLGIRRPGGGSSSALVTSASSPSIESV